MNNERPLLAIYGILLLALAAASIFGRFIGAEVEFMVPLLLFPVLLTAGLGILLWTLWRPSKMKALKGLAWISAGILVVFLTPALSRLGDFLFFKTRKSGLEAFTAELTSYGKIHEMSDGDRYFKELNGELVAYAKSAVDTTRLSPERKTYPVEQILVRDGIDRETYEKFRAKLRALRFTEVELTPAYSAYLYDGILDNLTGYLRVQPGAKAPTLRSELFGAELVFLKPIEDGWYYFVTT